MPNTIICSVGTSASKKLGIRSKDLEEWVNKHQSIEKAASEKVKVNPERDRARYAPFIRMEYVH